MRTIVYTVSVALFITAGAGVVYGQCDEQTIGQSLLQCLSEFNAATDFTSAAGFSAARLRSFCQNSANSEIRCAENLINRCRSSSSEAKEILDKTINVNIFRGSVKTVCDANNTAALEAEEDCLANHQEGVGSCIRAARGKYNIKLQSLKGEAISTGDVEEFKEDAYEALCEMTSEVKRCQNTFGKYCGRDVQVIFAAINEAITPPVCSACAAGISWLAVTTLAFVVILKEKVSV